MPDKPQETPDSLFNRATRYQEFGESITARDTFLAAIKIDPLFAKAWNSLGVVYKGLDDIDNARECFKKASSIESEWIDPITNLGLLEFSQKSYKESKEALLKYMELGGNNIEILVTLARCSFHLDDCKTVQKVTSLIIDIFVMPRISNSILHLLHSIWLWSLILGP